MTTMTTATSKIQIPDRQYFRIGDVAELVGVKPYVLRFWESEFTMIHPEKSSSGQRVYRRSDVETVLVIKHLLYVERFSIEGARKKIKELRKGGDLRDVKNNVAAIEAPAEPRTESPTQSTISNLEEIRKLTQEIKAIASTPLSDLFIY